MQESQHCKPLNGLTYLSLSAANTGTASHLVPASARYSVNRPARGLPGWQAGGSPAPLVTQKKPACKERLGAILDRLAPPTWVACHSSILLASILQDVSATTPTITLHEQVSALQHLLAPRTCCQVRRQRVDAEMWAKAERLLLYNTCAGPKAEGCRFVTQQRTVFGWCTSSSCVSTATTTHGAKQQHLYTYRNTLSGALVCWFGFSRNRAQPELSPQVYEQTTIAGVRFKAFPRGWWCRETPFWVGLLLATHSQQQQCCCKLQVARQQQL